MKTLSFSVSQHSTATFKWLLPMAFFFCLFAAGGGQRVLGQQPQQPPLLPNSVSPAGGRSTFDLSCAEGDDVSCNLICNPDLFSDNCPESVDIFGIGECESFSGWGSIATCDYFVTEANTIISPGALSIGVYDNYNTEVLTSGVTTVIGQKYLFSYVRKAIDEILTPNNANSVWQFPYLPQEMGVALGHQSSFPTDPLSHPGFQPNVMPFGSDQQIVSDTNFPDTEWRQIVTCFTANANSDALYFWLKNPDYGQVINEMGLSQSLIDHVELIEDGFPSSQTLNTGCNPITIGDNTCDDNLSLFHLNYTWQYSVDNGTNWIAMTETTPIITVLPNNVITLYRITRTMDNAAAQCPVIGSNCVSHQATIGVIKNDAICCTESLPFQLFSGSPNLAVTGNQTWNNATNPFGNINTNTNNVYVNGTITVKESNALVMNNLTLNFGPRGMIVVEPHASLSINNCRLRGSEQCKTMWQGIRIYKEAESNGSFLSITQNTVISDALVGVSTQKLPLQPLETIAANITTISDFQDTNLSTIALADIWSNPNVQATGGGLLVIDGAVFRNCFQGINASWKPQINNAATHLRNIEFKTTQSLYYPFDMLTQTECGVCGTNVAENLLLYDTDFTNLKYGVRLNNFNQLTINPTFVANGSNPPTNPPGNYSCTFTNCKVGVSGRNIFNNTNNHLFVWGSLFQNCKVGIQLQGSAADIRNNLIDNQTSNFQNQDIGIFALGSRFDIVDNAIEYTARGIVFTDADDLGNANIHQNYLNHNRFGIVGIGNSPTAHLSCNTISTYSHNAIALTAWPATGQTGNIPNQGNCDVFDPQPAANTFTPPAGGALLPDVLRLPNANPFLYSEFANLLPPPATGFEFWPTTLFQACAPVAPGTYDPDARCTAENYPIQPMAGGINGNEEEQNRLFLKYLSYYIQQKDTAAIYNLLNTVQTRLAIRLKIANDLANNRLGEAETMLNALPKNTNEDESFDYLHRLLLQKMQNNESIYTLTPNQQQQLNNIAQAKTATAYSAQAWLYAAKGTEFNLNIGDIDVEGWVDMQTSFKTDYTLGNSLKLYPNPAQDKLQITYYGNSQASLTIFDHTGQVVYNANLPENTTYSINTEKWNTGVYFYSLINKGEVSNKGKLLIIK